jgi:alpha-L-fucosidase
MECSTTLIPALGAVVFFALIPAACEAAEYQKSWDSLAKHGTPEWYQDAKFGIYYHWGPYSVPGFGSEWYSRNMYQPETEEYKHHVATYGPVDQFGYKDFIPMFTAEKFDALAWADLFQKAGARYIGPVAEHSDGFSMWDSKVNPWNAARMGPKRDLVGEMEKAARQKGLKFIATFHHQWHWGWYATPLKQADVFDPRFSGLYGTALNPEAFNLKDYLNPKPKTVAAFCDRWRDKVAEVVDRYHPDLIYFDSRTAIIDEGHRLEMLAHYYNQAQGRGQEVVLTYKNEDFHPDTGVIDLECGRMTETKPFKWQTDDKIEWNSWAYHQHPNYKPASRLVHQLVDIVSKNGNLMLNVGPRPDGTIPEPVQERLLQIGAWLKVNGEAIYGTRPFKVFGEGPTKIQEGHFGEAKLKEFTADDIRFTIHGDDLFAIALGWPAGGNLLIKTLTLGDAKVTNVEMLGCTDPLEWSQSDKGLLVKFPASKPCDFAWSLRVIRRTKPQS